MKFRFPLLFLAAFLVITCMSSCVHDYTCQCVIKYSGQPGLPDSLINEYKIRDTKKKAESACQGQSGTYNTGGITTVETCDLF